MGLESIEEVLVLIDVVGIGYSLRHLMVSGFTLRNAISLVCDFLLINDLLIDSL